eukprot:gene958-6463_t
MCGIERVLPGRHAPASDSSDTQSTSIAMDHQDGGVGGRSPSQAATGISLRSDGQWVTIAGVSDSEPGERSNATGRA